MYVNVISIINNSWILFSNNKCYMANITSFMQTNIIYTYIINYIQYII